MAAENSKKDLKVELEEAKKNARQSLDAATELRVRTSESEDSPLIVSIITVATLFIVALQTMSPPDLFLC